MICHELKCIFIHIPRCAGSSVEAWLTGQDWWYTEPATKHLTAGQARTLYAEYWDAYLTFSIVRDPMARFRSCLKFADHFGLVSRPDGSMDFTGYHARFGSSVVIEHDHRFHDRDALRHDGHRPGQIYGNILDTPLDMIARYETLDRDMVRLGRALGLRRPFDHHLERSRPADAPTTLPAETRAKIHALHRRDYEAFGYVA